MDNIIEVKNITFEYEDSDQKDTVLKDDYILVVE